MDRNQRTELPDASFQGFRVIRVENNVMTRIDYITLNDLRSQNYELAISSQRSGISRQY
jgi:hypothetical protein